jgi:hypothetical protein
MVVYVGITLLTHQFMRALENRSGFLMDTFLAYLAARFCLTDWESLITVTKWLAVILIPLALMGVLEATVIWRPYGHLRQYCPWRPDARLQPGRFGLERAAGPFGHAVLFGACFTTFLPLVYALRHQQGSWRTMAYFSSGMLIIGCSSTVSAGSVSMLITALFALAMERFKRWIKPLGVSAIVSVVLIGIISNRPFYHVIVTRLNPLGGSGWHRARLIDAAVEHLREWFWAGYGPNDPGWGSSLGMGWTDVTNQYLLMGVKYGVLGIIALCLVLVIVFHRLIRLHNESGNPIIKSWVWAFGSSAFSIAVVWNSIAFFEQMEVLFYCFLGMTGSLLNFGRVLSSRQLKRTSLGHRATVHNAWPVIEPNAERHTITGKRIKARS